MTEGRQRVVVWATGGIGSIAIRAIHQRPNLDLVGVWVHSPEKDGKDAGELANGDPIGLAATTDADALIALKPDCVVYAASGPERDALAIPDYVKLLGAGINVVTTSTTRLVNPHAYEPAEWRDQLVAAAKEGQASLYASGIEPGFAADYLPLVLTTQSASIEKIHAYEIGLYDDYGVPDIMSDAMGFGRPLDYQPWIGFPGAIAGEWQGQIRMIADALGVEVQEIREIVRSGADGPDTGGRDGNRRCRNMWRAADAGDRRRRRPRGHRDRTRHPAGARCRPRLAHASRRPGLPRGDHRPARHRMPQWPRHFVIGARPVSKA